MPNGLIAPPVDGDTGLTSDSGGGGKPPMSNKKKYIIAGGAVAGLLVIYLYAKSKSSSSASSTTAPPTLITPASNQDSTTASWADQLSQQDTADTNSLTQALSGITSAIAGNQSALLGAISSIGSTAPATPAPAPVTNTPGPLPPVNASEYAKQLLAGQWSAANYTEIGTVTNGVFNGTNVSGGVPVYANVYGGLQQGFNEKTLPSGTPLYIPTSLKAYE